jgi:transcriptional regulator with XRE-family HTH domain
MRRLGKRLRSLREKAGLTQVEIAEAAQLDEKHYQTIESGLANVTFSTLVALARAFGISLGKLLEDV